MSDPTIETRLKQLAERVQADIAQIGVLSTGEAIAVALILDRSDLLPASHPKVLDAVDRLGESWLRAAIAVQHEWF